MGVPKVVVVVYSELSISELSDIFVFLVVSILGFNQNSLTQFFINCSSILTIVSSAIFVFIVFVVFLTFFRVLIVSCIVVVSFLVDISLHIPSAIA